MVTKVSDNKFSWGDSVKVTESAPSIFNPGTYGSVCGMRDVENEKIANDFFATVGEVLYLIEFSSGSAIEVPEKYLQSY